AGVEEANVIKARVFAGEAGRQTGSERGQCAGIVADVACRALVSDRLGDHLEVSPLHGHGRNLLSVTCRPSTRRAADSFTRTSKRMSTKKLRACVQSSKRQKTNKGGVTFC